MRTTTLLPAARRAMDAAEERLVPRHLRARFTVPTSVTDERDRLRRDRMQIIPWLDRTRPLSGTRILEVGCGSGVSTVALAEQGCDVIALDVDAGLLRRAEQRCAAHGVAATFVPANAAEPLDAAVADDAMEWVIFWASLEHMTLTERLSAIRSAWTLLESGGLLTVIETPNRLWLSDSHTSLLPYFNWLPDELAFEYSRFFPRSGFNDAYREPSATNMLAFLRRGRGVSFHEFELAIGPARDLDVVACLQLDRRQRNRIRSSGWRMSRWGRFEALLRSQTPEVPRAFMQPFLYLSLRKP